MRHPPAHHPGVALDRHHIDAGTPKNIEIGLIKVWVIAVDTCFVPVEGVGVLHRELAHAQQTGARAWLVAKLGLDLIEHCRQLPVTLDILLDQVGHDLLVGHAQHHVPVVAIPKARHVAADLIPAARLLPQLGRMYHGQGHLLAADGIHLSTKDLFDLLFGAQRQREKIKNPSGDLVNHAGTHHQLVADHVGVSGHFAQGLKKQLGKTHRKLRIVQQLGCLSSRSTCS